MSCEQFEQRLFFDDSSQGQIHFWSHGDSINQYPFFVMQREEIDIASTHPCQNKDTQIGRVRDRAQGVRLTTRVNNTIFKTGLSQYRKVKISNILQSIIDQINARPSLQWLRKILKSIYGAKNQSVFPKLNFIVRQLNLQQAINERWRERSLKLLHKKVELMTNGKYESIRYEQLQKAIQNMNACIKEREFQKGFQIYWGKYRQFSKHQNSKREVLNFCNEFNTMAQHQSLKKVKNQLKDKNKSSQISKEKKKIESISQQK